MTGPYASSDEQRPPVGVPDGPYAVTGEMLASVKDPFAAARLIALSWALAVWAKPGTGVADYTRKHIANESERWAAWILNGAHR